MHLSGLVYFACSEKLPQNKYFINALGALPPQEILFATKVVRSFHRTSILYTQLVRSLPTRGRLFMAAQADAEHPEVFSLAQLVRRLYRGYIGLYRPK